MSNNAMIDVTYEEYRTMVLNEIRRRGENLDVLRQTQNSKYMVTQEQNAIEILCGKVVKMDDVKHMMHRICVPLDYVLVYGV